MAAVGPGGGVISKQPIKTSRRRYFQNGCRVEACGPLRRNHCIAQCHYFVTLFLQNPSADFDETLHVGQA